jgi:hypothetical protein
MRFAAKFGASDEDLVTAMESKPEANLGGGVSKFRIARPGHGKSGGARMIVALKTAERAVLMYGFEKKDLGNIRNDELTEFKKAAKIYLAYTDSELNEIVSKGALVQINKQATQVAETRSRYGKGIQERGNGGHSRKHGRPAQGWGD